MMGVETTDGSGFRLVVAIIGFLAVLLAVLLGKLLELGLVIYRRHERQLDLCVALYAEIGRGYSAIHLQNQPDIVAAFLNQTISLTVSNTANFAFDSIKADISILPNSVIDPVLAYYQYDSQSITMLKYMESEAYKKAPASQKKNFRQGVNIVFRYIEKSAPVALKAIYEEVERKRTRRYIKLLKIDITPLEHYSKFPKKDPPDVLI